jgi:hypothetical protein
MWKIYTQDNEGICIGTRYDNLHKAVGNSIRLGCVSYRQGLGRSSCVNPGENEWLFALSKRSCFEHEREVRAIWRRDHGSRECQNGSSNQSDDAAGQLVHVDLSNLIESVSVYPFCEQWFLDLTKSVIEKFGYQFPVRRSEMEQNISRG